MMPYATKSGIREVKPSLIVKGLCDEAEGVVKDLSIFSQFRLPRTVTGGRIALRRYVARYSS